MWTPAIASFTRFLKKRFSKLPRAIFLNPRDGNSFSFRATAYQKKGMYEEALKDFAKVLEYNPKDAGVVYNNRGFLFNKMGRFEEAMKENGKAIEVIDSLSHVYEESWIQMMTLHITIVGLL